MALDHTAWQMIERKRAEAGMPTLEAAGRPPRYIATAADAAHGWASTIRNASICWKSSCSKFDREDDHGRGNRSDAGRRTVPGTGTNWSMTRREAMLQLLRVGGVAAGAAGAAVWLSEHSFRPVPAQAEQARRDHRSGRRCAMPQVDRGAGRRAARAGAAALEDLGGIRRFVSRQDVVVLKPNIAWDRTPEQAANTNPEVVAEVVRQCWQAGAKRVIVTDVSCNEPRRCFQRSGIQAAARAEGAEVILPDPELFREVDLGGVVLEELARLHALP